MPIEETIHISTTLELEMQGRATLEMQPSDLKSGADEKYEIQKRISLASRHAHILIECNVQFFFPVLLLLSLEWGLAPSVGFFGQFATGYCSLLRDVRTSI